MWTRYIIYKKPKRRFCHCREWRAIALRICDGQREPYEIFLMINYINIYVVGLAPRGALLSWTVRNTRGRGLFAKIKVRVLLAAKKRGVQRAERMNKLLMLFKNALI